jgi:hypothetical protein
MRFPCASRIVPISPWYFPSFDVATGQLTRFPLTPTQIRRFGVNHTPNDGTRVEREDDSFVLRCE